MDAIAAFFVVGFAFTLGAVVALAFVAAFIVAILAFASYLLRQRG